MSEQKRKWLWVDSAMFSLKTIWFLLILTGFQGPFAGPELKDDYWPIAFWIFCCYLIPLYFWRPGNKNPILFTVTEILLNGGLCLFTIFVLHRISGLLIVPILLVGFVSAKKTHWWSVPSFLLIFFSGAFFHKYDMGEAVQFSIFFVILYGTGAAFGRMVEDYHRTQHLLQVIEEKNAALMQYAKQVERMSILEERNRMARDLHDVLGHSFISVTVGLDATIYLMDTDPARAKEKLVALRELTGTNLEEIRHNIHQMSSTDDDLPLSAMIDKIAKEFELHTATKVVVHTKGEEFGISNQSRITLIRCLQESLTNAKRHGNATSIEVCLAFGERNLFLQIQDNGIGSEQITEGFGLSAMRDRIAALRGSLTLTASPGKGMMVECVIPVVM